MVVGQENDAERAHTLRHVPGVARLRKSNVGGAVEHPKNSPV
jgi:hypothetical protein